MSVRCALAVLLLSFPLPVGAGEVEDVLAQVKAGQAELEKLEMAIPEIIAEREFLIRGTTEKAKFVTTHNDGTTLVVFDKYRVLLTPKEFTAMEKSAKTGEYAVVMQSATKPAEGFAKMTDKRRLAVNPLLAADDYKTVLELIGREGFNAERVTRVNTLVSITYRCPRPGLPLDEAETGTLTFDPANSYAIVGVQYQAPIKGDSNLTAGGLKLTKKFGNVGGRLVVLEATQNNYLVPSTPGENTTKVKYTYPAQATTPPEQLTTAHYNVTPPPVEVPEDRPPFNWPLWGCVGAGCVALSVVLGWFVRRRLRRQA